MRFVVTATPGSGTRYLTEVLKAAGVDAGHERALHHGTAEGGFQLLQCRHDAEVSWYAAPWLHLFAFPTIHLVRAPLDTISTLTRMRKWSERPHHQGTFRRFAADAFDYPPGPQRMARFWLDWNTYAERADHRWRLDELPADEIYRILQAVELRHIEPSVIAEAIRTTRPTGSRRNGRPNYDWTDLGPLEGEVRERAAAYGFDT